MIGVNRDEICSKCGTPMYIVAGSLGIGGISALRMHECRVDLLIERIEKKLDTILEILNKDK